MLTAGFIEYRVRTVRDITHPRVPAEPLFEVYTHRK